MPADEAKFLDLGATRMHMVDYPVVQAGHQVTIGGPLIKFP